MSDAALNAWWPAVPPRRWPVVWVILPCLFLSQDAPVPMKEVRISGASIARDAGGHVDLVLTAGIATPLGRVPINGHLSLNYDCNAAFRGEISYHPLVRFLAMLKHVDLVSETDGRVSLPAPLDGASCRTIGTRIIRGAATVEALRLSGFIAFGTDSLAFRGPAWSQGDSTYHSRLTTRLGGDEVAVEINLYER